MLFLSPYALPLRSQVLIAAFPAFRGSSIISGLASLANPYLGYFCICDWKFPHINTIVKGIKQKTKTLN
jgi:hypothetical protein